MTEDKLAAIIRPIVEGQIRGFLKEHTVLVEAVDWFKPRQDRATTLVNSLAKRINRDLLCPHTRARMEAVFLEGSLGTPAKASSVELSPADEQQTAGI